MDLIDLLTVIPELLLCFIPGYISLRIKEMYSPEKHRSDYDTTTQSIIYSFIIGIAYSFIVYISTSIFNSLAIILQSESIKQFIYFLLACFLGRFLVWFPNSAVGMCIYKKANPSLDPSPNVWIKALKNEKGAWATVYLKNGLIYTGKLRYYTSDPDDNLKLLLLYSYRLSVRDDQKNSSGSFCYDIKDTTQEANSKVLLNYEDIVSIEIENGIEDEKAASTPIQ